jgi:lysophospholipase L1-like esterase
MKAAPVTFWLLLSILPLSAFPEVKNPRITEGGDKADNWSQTWTASGKFSLIRDTATYHSEPASLSLKADGGPAKGQVMQEINAKAGETFTVTGYLRADAGATALLGVMAYDEKWQGLGFTAVGNALTGPNWVRASGQVKLPERTAHASIVLGIEGIGQVWLDDVSADGTDLGDKAQPKNAPSAPAPPKPAGPRKPTSSTDPAEGFYPDYPKAWQQTFDGQIARAKQGNIPLLFLGDSLTQAWPKQSQWKQFEEKGAVSFGIGGDGTSQILWRLDHGLIDGLNPKTIVLLIGVNNVWPGFGAEDTIKGIRAVLDRLKQKAPAARIVLCGNTHFFIKGDGNTRKRVRAINAALSKLADGKQIRFIDFSEKLLGPGDELNPEFYSPDKLHLTAPAYGLWADAIAPEL